MAYRDGGILTYLPALQYSFSGNVIILYIFFVVLNSGNGYITTEVLREILSELDNNMSDEELDQMIDEIDADGSGTVDFDGKLNNEKPKVDKKIYNI